jgi:hypothetical protein
LRRKAEGHQLSHAASAEKDGHTIHRQSGPGDPGLIFRFPREVERDDGEDVLIKKRLGADRFEVEVQSNTVAGVRIRRDRE